jgi:nucleoid-associated protein YgaU
MDRFELLKNAYAPAIQLLQRAGAQMHNLNLQDDKLFVKASVASEQMKNDVWNAIKAVNPNYDDIMADIDVNPALAPAAEVQTAPAGQSYTVQAGDTLSKIAKQFYGNAQQYMKIFEANKDKLKDPNMIQVGQVLRIP